MPLLSRRAVSFTLLIAALSCGGEGSTSPTSEASVVLTGQPLGPVLVGSTVQLLATPVNSTGTVLPGLAVTWKSSDPAVAVVSTAGLVTAAGPGTAKITASTGKAEGSTSIDVRAGGVVSTSGATISMLDAATFVIPPFAVSQSITVMLGWAPSAPPGTRLVGGTAIELGPDGLTFSRAGTLTVRYDPSKVPSGVIEPALQLYMVSAGAWTLVRGSVVSTSAHTVTAAVSRSGVYAVAGTPVDHITVGGPAVNSSMYVGQSGQLSATLFDADNTTLANRPIAWTTSDASKATVDTSGKVTGIGAGTVTITAASDGKSASTTLTILARVGSDWSGAVEWTTYQGNASHTGYQPVSADPAMFKQLWTTTIGTGALNPVTAGNGEVFVSTNAYFGTQIAKALDAQTGAEKWSRDFGAIHSVDPPAYDNGMVYLQTGGHGDSYLWGLDAGTGTVKVHSPYGNQWSRWYAPTIVGSTVYVAGGYYGGMYAFNGATGAQSWFVQLNQYDLFTPAVADGLVYAYTGSYSPKLTVVTAATGALAYESADPTFSWDGWSMNQAPVVGSASNLLSMNGGRILSFNLSSRAIGYQIKSSFTGQLSLANGVIYVINGKAVEARNERDGALRWAWTPPEGQPSYTLALTRNLLFVSTAANVYAVDLATQKHVWTYPAAGMLAVSSQGILFIAGQTGGKLTAISLR